MGARVAVETIATVSLETAQGVVTQTSVQSGTVRVAADATAVASVNLGTLKADAFGASVNIAAQDAAPFWSYLPVGGSVYAFGGAYHACKP